MNAPTDAFLHDKLQALQAQADEFIAVRRDIHQHPEMGYKEYRTSDLVAEQLRAWGYQVTRGLGGTGVVGQIKKGTGSRSIGIRADMDALPIDEATGLPYASCNVGIMHACGHDGHTAMLLAAAKHIAHKAEFSGTVNLIFQPAEEGLGGAKKMMEDGLFKQFPCDAVFGMHNMPGHPQGQLVFRDGPAMASSDNVTITIEGTGGHGALPHRAADPVVAGSAIVMGLQSIVARNIDPQQVAIITVGAFNAGVANNVIPQTATLRLSVRSLDRDVRILLEKRITELVHAQAANYGRQGPHRLPARLPGAGQPPARDRICSPSGRRTGRRHQRHAPRSCTHGQRRLCLHARGGARLLFADRQWRWHGRRPRRLHGAQPRLRLQRPERGRGLGLLVLVGGALFARPRVNISGRAWGSGPPGQLTQEVKQRHCASLSRPFQCPQAPACASAQTGLRQSGLNMSELIQTVLIYALPVIFAITLHEAAHGYAALRLGDNTASMLGRVTLNPIPHIDPVGTILLPLLLYFSTSGAFLFGYAKPVPVRFDRLRHPKRDMVWVALAGPGANLVQALLWGVLFYLLTGSGVTERFFIEMCKAGMLTNVVMFAFNLFPLPPLDGGRILVGVLPWRQAVLVSRAEPWGFFIVMALVLTGLISTWWMQPLMGLTFDFLKLTLSPLAALLR